MAVTFPTVNGNWSNPAIWSGSTLPTINDDVIANNKTVIIDQNVSVKTLRNIASGSAVGGGSFTVSGSYTIQTSVGIAGTSVIVLNILNASPDVVTVISTLDGSNIGGGQRMITVSGSGTVNFIGDIYSSVNAQAVINLDKVGTTNIIGNLYGQTGPSLLVNNSGQVNITGDAIGASSYTPIGIPNTFGPASASVSLTGNLTVRDTAYGIYYSAANARSIRINVTGTITNSSSNPAVYVRSAVTASFFGAIYANSPTNAINIIDSVGTCNIGGIVRNYYQFNSLSKSAIFSPSITVTPSNQFRWTFYDTGSANTTTLFAQGYVPDSPSQADVRYGISYLNGNLSGSLQMPQPSQVISGVKTDNTTGSYNVTVEALTEAVWSKLTSILTGSNTIGERLKNNSTIDSTGQQLQALI